jgi:two-component system NtrC family sensor kinase
MCPPRQTPRLRPRVRVLLAHGRGPGASEIQEGLERELDRVDLQVAPDLDHFAERLLTDRPDLVILRDGEDAIAPEEALRWTRRHDRHTPTVLLNGTTPPPVLERLILAGLNAHLDYDDVDGLAATARTLLHHSRERRRAEADRARLTSSEARFQAVVDGISSGVMVTDAAGRVVFCNRATEGILEYSRAQLVGRSVERCFTSAEPHINPLRLVGSPGGATLETAPVTGEVLGRRADGTLFPAEVTVTSWMDQGHRFYSVEVRDVTRRKEISRQHALLTEAVEQAEQSICITDVLGTIEYVNGAFESMTGFSRREAVGCNPRILRSERTAPAVFEEMWRELNAGRPYLGEFVNRRRDGSEYLARVHIFPIRDRDGEPLQYVAVGQDVTWERSLEERFRQAQKMEALGQLAGGIAHDFNNLLTGIMGNSEILGLELNPDDPELATCIADITSCATRGRDLVKRLMSLSREKDGSRSPVHLTGVVDEAARLIRRLLPRNIACTVHHRHRDLVCLVNEGALNQALLNLATNARDAMPDGGTLRLSTRRVGGGVPEAVIEVSDTGEGMPAEIKRRLFEPFFTTKPQGKGTGLGMAMVHGFVRASHGRIQVESEPGAGTRIMLHLPMHEAGGGEHRAFLPSPLELRRLPPERAPRPAAPLRDAD